ncbi:unnamed protein product [Symbiodinium sp. CCMP2592]|nr:unnamed protein product [Symbiodinium sp. CCMP2592]
MNADALHCIVEVYGPNPVHIEPLQKQVTKLYELVEQEAAEGAFYQESWDLRRLITFAWKRQYDAGVRNLFALIQSIRQAQENPDEQEDEEYQEDECEDEEPVPDEAAPEDDEEAYDQWDEDEEEEHRKEADEGQEEGEEEQAEDEMPPPPPKKLRKMKSKARLRKGLSKESSEDPVTPASKLPRASTDESYQEVPTASKEEELKQIMDKIKTLQMQRSPQKATEGANGKAPAEKKPDEEDTQQMPGSPLAPRALSFAAEETKDDDKRLAADDADGEPESTGGFEEGEEEQSGDWENDEVIEPEGEEEGEEGDEGDEVDPRMQAKLRQKIKDEMKPRGKKAAAMKGAAKAKAKSKAKAEKAPKTTKDKIWGKMRKGGKQRVPPKLSDGTVLSLGCSSCRFAERGCPTCEKATFRGKRRSDVSPETIRKARATLQSKAAKAEE